MNSVILKPSLDPLPSLESPSPSASGGGGLRLGRSLRMHRSVAIAVGLVVFALAIAFGLSRKPLYEAESLIYIQPTTAKLVTDATAGFYDPSRYDSYIQQQLQTITREDILSEALKKLPVGYWQFPGESTQSAIARLQSSLKVERVQGSYEVSISLKGGNAITTTEVVNQVTAAFLKKGRVDELAQSDQQLQLLTEERQRILADLTQDRQEQNTLSNDLGVADTTGETGNPYDAGLGDMRKQVADARAAHEVAVAQLASVTANGSQAADGMNAAAEEIINNDPGLSTLKRSITERKTLLTTEMAGMTPLNTQYKRDQAELAQLDQQLRDMSSDLRAKAAKQLQGKLKLEAERTADIQSRLESQLARQTAVATGAAPKLQRAADLNADITRLQARFTETDNAIHSLELQESSAGLAHLSLPAVVPQSPAPSKKPMILGMSLPLAFVCATLSAVMLQKLDRTVYIADDVRAALKFQPMAVLPDPNEVSARVSEESLLRLVSGIDQARRTGDAKTFVFTGTSAGTDTTLLVASLASRMNQIGYRTMILRSSTVLNTRAVADEEVSTGWKDTRLSRVGESRIAGVRRESHVFENFERLKQNVDLVFVNALPILTSAETEFVARLADVTMLIAESGQTKRGELVASLALVQRLSAAGVASVLVDVALKNADDEFLAAIRSVEQRQSEVKRPRPSQRGPSVDDQEPTFHEESGLLSQNSETPV